MSTIQNDSHEADVDADGNPSHNSGDEEDDSSDDGDEEMKVMTRTWWMEKLRSCLPLGNE